jgi:hypothetical protein
VEIGKKEEESGGPGCAGNGKTGVIEGGLWRNG